VFPGQVVFQFMAALSLKCLHLIRQSVVEFNSPLFEANPRVVTAMESDFPRTPVAPPPVKNPFSANGDRLGCDREHFPSFSPSVFRTDQMNDSNTFYWTIDEMSHLRPANIDEAPVQHQVHIYNQSKWDREKEIQNDIDKFFSQKLVVPSPWGTKQTTKQVTFSPYPPAYINESLLLSPEQDANMSISDAAVQTETCSQECKDELGISYSNFVEEVEKLQDLSLTSIQQKLFEAPLEVSNDEEAMSVIAEVDEDGFDGRLITNSVLKVRQ
jgi:hypothetical protein